MRDAGISETDVETIVWQNPIAFFGQTGRIDTSELAGPGDFDQTALFEGNSVLRGQAPRKSDA
jgi:hypothetical protein